LLCPPLFLRFLCCPCRIEDACLCPPANIFFVFLAVNVSKQSRQFFPELLVLTLAIGPSSSHTYEMACQRSRSQTLNHTQEARNIFHCGLNCLTAVLNHVLGYCVMPTRFRVTAWRSAPAPVLTQRGYGISNDKMNTSVIHLHLRRQVSTVAMATSSGFRGSIPGRFKRFFSACRSALGPTQPSILLVPGSLPGDKANLFLKLTSDLLVTRSRLLHNSTFAIVL
jgi:hypothetical protein